MKNAVEVLNFHIFIKLIAHLLDTPHLVQSEHKIKLYICFAIGNTDLDTSPSMLTRCNV